MATATPKYYEGQEFHNPSDPSAPVLVYKAGKFIPKAPLSGTTVTPDQFQTGRDLLSKIDSVKNRAGFWTTGTVGGVLAEKLPGSPAYDLNRDADTIRANLAFQELKKLKAASATGASGLGATSDNELRLLQSTMGSLDVGQSPKQFGNNLDSIRRRAVEATPGVSMENPVDLSGGQSRADVPIGVFYRDPQGNIRRNDNGDKGNPILKAAKAAVAEPGVKDWSDDQLKKGLGL